MSNQLATNQIVPFVREEARLAAKYMGYLSLEETLEVLQFMNLKLEASDTNEEAGITSQYYTSPTLNVELHWGQCMSINLWSKDGAWSDQFVGEEAEQLMAVVWSKL